MFSNFVQSQRNGAEAWRLCWGADRSARGFDQSFGIMINYRCVQRCRVNQSTVAEGPFYQASY